MFELSHRLIGIYKTSNATRSRFHSLVPLQLNSNALHQGIAIDNHKLQEESSGTVRE